MKNDYSRALLLASNVTSCGTDLFTHLTGQIVAVSVDVGLPGGFLTARVLITTLRRLPIQIVLITRTLTSAAVDALRIASASVDPKRPLKTEECAPANALRVHIGLTAERGVIRAIPERHGAHIVRDDRELVVAPASPLGSVFAAATVAAEAFKYVASVRPSRMNNPVHMAFCPVSLTSRPGDTPALVMPFRVEGALVGLGAIGTGTALVLGEMSTRGRISLVDQQKFGSENVATYSLGGAPDVDEDTWKTELAARALPDALSQPYNMSAAKFVELVDRREIPAPRIVLAGLDNVEARHEVQRLWPDTLLDGATGDTMLGLHAIKGAEGPCVMCFLPRQVSSASPLEEIARVTGLPIRRLAEGDDVLREEDLHTLGDEQQRRLQKLVGRQICGLADTLGLTNLPTTDGFQPSVPFVSLQSSCLIVGRLMAEALGVRPNSTFVQYDALFGPTMATIEQRRPLVLCYCQQRKTTVRAVRAQRLA
jgi:hypothetical protein